MQRRNKKSSSSGQKDLTAQYLAGAMDEDRVDTEQRFTDRSKHSQQNKIMKTAAMREDQLVRSADFDTLPQGMVVQVFSLYCDVVQDDGKAFLCVVRKTMVKVQGEIVVGDRVKFRLDPMKAVAEGYTSIQGRSPDGVIEQIQPRTTLLTRADSFKALVSHPIVANAEQVLIVASLAHPRPKWGLIDRMIVAARAGGLLPVVNLNKVDLAETEDGGDIEHAREALAHYRTIEVRTIETSVEKNIGIDEIRALLKGRITVLAGHSGVGKSSVIRAVQPALDLRVGEVSKYTQKGRHTTTSARHYPLEGGGSVIDTPGVKLFGLWNVTRANLLEYFPDIEDETAPKWRQESYERILESLKN